MKNKPDKLAIEYVSVDSLIPYVNNARTHSAEQVSQIAASIKEFGFTNPVLIDGENGLIAGHGRVMAARKMGMKEVPSIQLSHLTAVQKRAYILADNKLALNAGWDDDLLALELSQLDDLGFDMALIGFTDEELGDLMPSEETAGLTDEDAVPEVKDDPVTSPGDVWIMGKHRVMCGDSTSIDSVDKLMAGAKADMIFTDPPYGMSYGGGRGLGSTKNGAKVKGWGMIQGDDLRNDDLQTMVRDSIASAIASSKEGASLYVCLTWRTYTWFAGAMESLGREIKALIVWDKKSIGLGNSHYRPQHEFIFYCGGQWHGDKAQGDVWHMSRGATGGYVHPTQKPVELVEKAINNSSKSGDVIIDCFGGSGTTMIACEKINRHARLMEIDPIYCDVIVKRWQSFTGKQATLEGDGRVFDDVAAKRTVAAMPSMHNTDTKGMHDAA